MKKLLLLSVFFLSQTFISCSDDDNNPPADEFSDVPVSAKTSEGNGFKYKTFYQENASPETRKGIIILAHGDDTDENDGTLNDQCKSLAQNGYIAVTTSYVTLNDATFAQINQKFQENIEQVIVHSMADYEIPRNKVIIGGLSRGGNNTFPLVLPGQDGINPIAGIKGVILMCSGGDVWKGSAILFPVAYMSTENDDVMDANANNFKNGLRDNMRPGVSENSECLIIPGNGHCTATEQYKPFIIKKVRQWLP